MSGEKSKTKGKSKKRRIKTEESDDGSSASDERESDNDELTKMERDIFDWMAFAANKATICDERADVRLVMQSDIRGECSRKMHKDAPKLLAEIVDWEDEHATCHTVYQELCGQTVPGKQMPYRLVPMLNLPREWFHKLPECTRPVHPQFIEAIIEKGGQALNEDELEKHTIREVANLPFRARVSQRALSHVRLNLEYPENMHIAVGMLRGHFGGTSKKRLSVEVAPQGDQRAKLICLPTGTGHGLGEDTVTVKIDLADSGTMRVYGCLTDGEVKEALSILHRVLAHNGHSSWLMEQVAVVQYMGFVVYCADRARRAVLDLNKALEGKEVEDGIAGKWRLGSYAMCSDTTKDEHQYDYLQYENESTRATVQPLGHVVFTTRRGDENGIADIFPELCRRMARCTIADLATETDLLEKAERARLRAPGRKSIVPIKRKDIRK